MTPDRANAPQRRLHLTLDLHADDLRSLVQAIEGIATDLAIDGRTAADVSSGGWSDGYHLTLRDQGEHVTRRRPTVTDRQHPAISEDTRDAIIEVVWRWERYADAKHPVMQAEYLTSLNNAMSDLATWVPRCCEGGFFGQEHECWKSDGSDD